MSKDYDIFDGRLEYKDKHMNVNVITWTLKVNRDIRFTRGLKHGRIMEMKVSKNFQTTYQWSAQIPSYPPFFLSKDLKNVYKMLIDLYN